MLQKQPLQFSNAVLHVKKYVEPRKRVKPSDVQPGQSQSTEKRPYIIEVSGVAGQAPALIKAFFCNKDISGGGPIQELINDPQTGCTMILFRDPRGEHAV